MFVRLRGTALICAVFVSPYTFAMFFSRSIYIATIFLLSINYGYGQLQCDNDSIGVKSLIDLKTGYYLGFQGGLYPGGSNTMPYPHYADGVNLARQVKPLDAAGNVDLLDGKVGFICLGASTAGNAFNRLKSYVDDDSTVNPCLKLVNCAVGAKGVETMVDTTEFGWYWDEDVFSDLSGSNLSNMQVQIIWIMVTSRVDTILYWPFQPRQVEDRYKQLMPVLMAKFPNLKQVYVSGFHYGGYADPTKEFYGMIHEPVSYWNNWSVKFLVEDQINGDTALTYSGPDKRSAWIAWGPHLWADGLHANVEDGLRWICELDYRVDGGGYHLSNDGKNKEAYWMYQFFKSSGTTADWFRYSNRWTSCDPDMRSSAADAPSDLTISVYPNPASNYVTVTAEGFSGADATVHLTDMLGKIFVTEHLEIHHGTGFKVLDLTGLQAGMYYLHMGDEAAGKGTLISIIH